MHSDLGIIRSKGVISGLTHVARVYLVYEDRDLQEATPPACDDAVGLVDAMRGDAAADDTRGDAEVIDRLSTSRVSKSSSPKLLDAVLLDGD